MSGETRETAVVPWGIVLMVVGLIVMLTAAVIWFFLPGSSRATALSLPPPVTVVVTPLPPPANGAASGEDGATAVALMPETPLEASYPAHFVSVADALKNAQAGSPRRIVIPAIDLDAPVTSIGLAAVRDGDQTYFQWQVPNDFQAGWHNTSAPLGQPGNTVLNGHHNIYGEVFRRLVELKIGDAITMYDAERAYAYAVAEVEILKERDEPLAVRQENARWIEPTADERLTLVTCWPYTDNSHRLVVVARPVTTSALP
jgi:sortase A